MRRLVVKLLCEAEKTEGATDETAGVKVRWSVRALDGLAAKGFKPWVGVACRAAQTKSL